MFKECAYALYFYNRTPLNAQFFYTYCKIHTPSVNLFVVVAIVLTAKEPTKVVIVVVIAFSWCSCGSFS